MSLFGNARKIKELSRENAVLRERNKELVNLCNEKDSYFDEMISDGLRHGSPLAAKHMSDKKKYYKNGGGKYGK